MNKSTLVTGSIVLAVLLISATSPAPCAAQHFEGTVLSSTTSPYGAPPYTYEGSRFINITVQTSPEVLEALVPEPLVASPNGVMQVLIGRHQVVAPRPYSYHEVILSVPVSYADTQGRYYPVLYLDDAIAIVAGREIYGYTKVDAEISFIEEGETIRARVERDGTALIDATLRLGAPVEPIPSVPATPGFNVKWIPPVEKGAPPAVMQLTMTTLKDYTMTELRGGEATLAFGSTDTDPLGDIPILQVLGATYSVSNFILDYGKVVYDYLAEGEGTAGLSEKKK